MSEGDTKLENIYNFLLSFKQNNNKKKWMKNILKILKKNTKLY